MKTEELKTKSQNSKILVVDDEPDIRKILADILKNESFQIQCASDGREAIAMFQVNHFDLVITDIRMPGMDGLEVMRRVKQLDEAVEVIILTGHAGLDNAIQALRMDGAFDYISKPLEDIDKLVNTANQALRKRELLLENRSKTATLIKTHDELKRREKRYRMLIEKMLNGFALHEIICDETDKPKDYRFLAVNPAFEEMTGFNATDVVGKTVREVLPKLEPYWIDEYGKVALTGESVRFEGYAGQLGKYYEVLAYRPEKGRFATVFTDITNRKQAEENLKISEREKVSLLNSMLDFVIYQNKNQEIIWANRSAGRSVGLTPEKMIGRHCYEVLRRKSEPCENCPAVKCFQSGRIQEAIVDGPDGKVWLNRCHPVYDETDTMTGALVLIQDITEKRMMEAELQKARKLESIGILAGSIAHDYNNLLSVIMGNISLARLDLKTDDDLDKLLNSAEQASLEAKNLTHKLITFAEGGTPIKRETSITPLLKDTVELALSGSNIKNRFCIVDALQSVEIDESQIGQVIQHLVINAEEAMPEGGTLTIGAESISLDEANTFGLDGGEYIKVWVQDSGVGIPEKDIGKIFDPYFSVKEMGIQKGMGLGLSLCHSIIKNHGGVIVAESEVGIGATFHFYLPIFKKKPAENEYPRQYKKKELITGKGKILLMDDEEMVRDIAGRMLSHLGYDVEFSKDGAEAVELYKKEMASKKPFDAVILDLTIHGGMGGRETIQKLLKIDPGVQGIVSSGYSEDLVISKFKKYGFTAALAKPYTIKQLDEIIRKTILTDA